MVRLLQQHEGIECEHHLTSKSYLEVSPSHNEGSITARQEFFIGLSLHNLGKCQSRCFFLSIHSVA